MSQGKASSGLLLYRRGEGGLEVFLVHPGGPFFAEKDAGAWTIPKGEPGGGEGSLATARREFAEETGRELAACARGEPFSLGSVRQKGGKTVEGWAVEGEWPAGAEVASNTFTLEWPPRSGRRATFPEVDRGAFFDLATAREKINPAQVELLDRLEERMGG